jgi:hypothetical protein
MWPVLLKPIRKEIGDVVIWLDHEHSDSFGVHSQPSRAMETMEL